MAEFPSELQAEVEKLERKHAENPEGRYFVPLANAYRKAGDIGYAEALLREGLRRHPDYLSAHIVLGRCLADRGAMREASEEFRYVLSVDPQNLIALRTLGELAASEGRRAEAERWFEELLAVDPMNEEARRAIEELRGGTTAGDASPEGDGWSLAAEETRALESLEAGSPLDALPPLDPSGVGDGSTGAEDDWSVGRDLPLLGGASEEDESLPGVEDDAEEAPQVVTETIAELYARQGFFDRAADTLRELIRRRGGDEALERRLAEVERLAAGGAPVAEAEPEVVEEAPAAEPLPAAEPPEFASYIDLGDEVGLDAVADVPEPQGSTFVEEPVEPSVAETDPFADSFGDGFAPREPEAVEASGVVAGGAAASSIAAYLSELLAWRAGGETPAAPVDVPSSAPEPEPSGMDPSGTGPAGDQAFPWEASPAQPAPEVEPVASEELYDFEAFFAETAGTPSTPEPVEPAPQEPTAPEEQSDAGSDDEDLESFQAWLRSLKQ